MEAYGSALALSIRRARGYSASTASSSTSVSVDNVTKARAGPRSYHRPNARTTARPSARKGRSKIASARYTSTTEPALYGGLALLAAGGFLVVSVELLRRMRARLPRS